MLKYLNNYLTVFNMNMFPKKFSPILLIILFVIIFTVGFFVGKSSVVCRYCAPEDLDFSLFWEAWHTLQEKYVSPGEIDSEQLLYGAISGMIKSIGDPYTVFMDPEDNQMFLEDVSGSFGGVGMEVGIRNDILQVIAPLKNTPAEKAGLRSGDKIIKVGDLMTVDLTIDEAVSLIRGEKGTDVTLTIFREGWDSTKDFTITRATIEIPSLDWEIKNGNVAYVELYQFSEIANSVFRQTAKDIIASSADRIVLDLRNNPGGYLEVAQDIAGWFLEKGQVVVVEDFGDKRDKELYKSRGNAKLANYPIVILINQGSASASEILAAALRDNRGVQLIGQTSFGKGSVQELAMLSNESSLKVTVAKWLTPNEELIAGVGLDPDIEVELTDEDFDNDIDPQLDKALEIIKEMK